MCGRWAGSVSLRIVKLFPGTAFSGFRKIVMVVFGDGPWPWLKVIAPAKHLAESTLKFSPRIFPAAGWSGTFIAATSSVHSAALGDAVSVALIFVSEGVPVFFAGVSRDGS